MFEVYDNAEQAQSARRFAASGLLAAGVCAAIAVAAVAYGGRVQTLVKEAKVDVIFKKPLEPKPEVKVEPPPPPPSEKPKKLVKKVEAAPVVEPAPMVAPVEVPLEMPPETDEKNAVAEGPIAVGGAGELRPGAIAGVGNGTLGEGTEVAAAGGKRAPINLPEDATPPVEESSNAAPAYPADARTRGLEGVVILKIVVEADGSVGAIKVMKGEEPFVAAALTAIQSWKYRPALVEGRPTAVFRIVKIPFRIKQ